jgi:hypothetical protein
MTARWRMLSGVSATAVGLSLATAVWAQQPQDPSTGGQLNQCWGQVASGIAQLDTPEGTSGGGMGQHSRSTQAANNNGGFANDNNGFGITFNVKEDGGNAGRVGVGNVSAGPPHNTHPGDGGNGQHAINNSNETSGAGFANILDPVTGQFQTGPVPEDQHLGCDLVP